MRLRVYTLVLCTAIGLMIQTAQAQQRPAVPAAPAASAPSDPFPGLKFRNIGPATMGGRIDDVAVLESNPAVFYVGAATGGLWKTVNNGTTWTVHFDDLDDVVSVGDIAINPNDANIPYETVNGVKAKGGSFNGPGPVVAGGMVFMNAGYNYLGFGIGGNVLLAFSPQ